MIPSRLRSLRVLAGALVLNVCALAPMAAHAQFASVLNTNSRYAGNSTGTAVFNGDSGTASATSLNTPSFAMFDSLGNLFVSDTANNCVRRITPAGIITTVAGLRVPGGVDTCNTLTDATPTAAQGLLRPTGLAIDSSNTLYIADSLHHCVRSLASGVVDSFAANALTTVAGTCSSVDTASVTPVPSGLALDASGNLYIALRDSAAAAPVNQVVRHLAADPATTVCYLAGQPSANVATACPGIASTVTLSNPGGLAFDTLGNLYLADTGNNCVREIAAFTTQTTAAGQCTNDHTGNSATALHSPFGLAVAPTGALLISETALTSNNVVSFSSGTGALTTIAGLPSGTGGPYLAALDGQSSLNAGLNAPLGLTTDTEGNIYLADSANNIVREMGPGTLFRGGALSVPAGDQVITFAVNQTVNLGVSVGIDYTISSNTCAGALAATPLPAPPTTCQVTVRFTPTLPGPRNSALQLTDSLSGKLVSVALMGTGTGPLSLFTPGTVNSVAGGLRSALGVSVDTAGNTYVLEQGNGFSSADVLRFPAGGGAATAVVAQGAGLITPTSMAMDPAGNIFVTDATLQSVSRFGADGSVDTAYVTGLVAPTAIQVDGFGNLFIAQSGSAHNVIEVYAAGSRRIVAGSGSNGSADNVAAANALFVTPSGLTLTPAGLLYLSDAAGRRVYDIDSAGIIHIVAGNGTTTTTIPGQATGTAMLTPVSVAPDAAGDVYIVDQTANRIYEVLAVPSNGVNITTVLGTGIPGYTGDGGPAASATIQQAFGVALDSLAQIFVLDSGNGALRAITYPASPTLNFGDVIVPLSSTPRVQGVSNVGNASLQLSIPFTTSDTHFSVSSGATTCGATVLPGAQCNVGYTFTPSTLGIVTGQSILASNSPIAPQTIQLTAYGLFTQPLPYALVPQTEVFGQPFSEVATINLVYPDLVPAGTFTYTIAGKQLCTVSGSFPTAGTCLAASSGLGVGTYTVNFSYISGDTSYYSTTGTTTLTISPGTLIVTPADVTKLYGAAIPALPVTVTGTVNGDFFLISATTTAIPSSPVGGYPISATLTGVGLANLNNYNVTYNTGTLTITPLALTVTVNNASRQYGLANPTFTSVVSGSAPGDTFTVAYSTQASIASPVGTYAIGATVSGPNAANYNITVVPGALTVTAAPLTVTVNNATRMYGAANPTFTGTTTGALNGDTFTTAYSTTATAASPVGTYPITASISGPAASNYALTVVTGAITITKSTVPVTVTVNSATRTYGAANPAFTGTTTGALNGDAFTIAYTTPATVTSSIGTYAVTPVVSGAALANYANVTLVNGTLTVTPAALTITANSVSRTYGAANPAWSSTFATLLNGDTATVTYTTAATPATPVGTYAITPSVVAGSLSNYTVTLVPGTLTITQAPLMVTVANATRAYGAANPTFTATLTGALDGDTFTNAFSTTATATSGVGTYPITDVLSGLAAANYAIAIAPGTLTITQATGAVTVAVNNASRFYGSANPTFTSTTTGAMNGDTFTVTYATAAKITSPIGTYAIVPTVSGAATANYASITVVNGTLTVTAAPLTVTVANASRIYGSANPTFTSTANGAVNGDAFSFTYATPATAASPVGTYAINATPAGSALANYTVTVVPGTLTVTPAALTVTVANATRPYATANPSFTGTTTGALNGDTFTSAFSTTATINSPVGTYPITDAVSGPAAANYTVTVVPGVLTITQATAVVTVTANSANRLYGASNPTFTGTIIGLQNGDTLAVTYTTSATPASPVGSYAIVATVSGPAAANYTVGTANGTLTVTPAPLTVTVNSASRPVNTANPTFTGTVTGLLNGDAVTVVYATAATISSPVGTYPIAAAVSGPAAANYAVTSVPGMLTITAPALTVTVTAATRSFGAANPTFTYTIAGALNGDTFTVVPTTTATTASPVGTYPITATVTGADLAAYTLSVVPGTLTVTAAGTSVSVVSSGSPAVVGSPVTFTATVSSAGGPVTGAVLFYDGSTLLGPGTLNGNGIATFTTSTLIVGTHTVTATYQAAGNFATSTGSVSQTITATPTPLTVTIANAARLYGSTNPTFTGIITGALNGDTFTVTYATTATNTSPIGSYPITATVTGANAAAYTITVIPGTLTIAPAPLTVTANNATRAANTANPTFTGTITGAVNGDTFTIAYTTTATTASPVGTYLIAPAVSGTAAANYIVTLVPGVLTITAGTTTPLTVTLANATRLYGSANPTFISSITGALNGDTFAVTYSTTATAASPVGSYPITATVTGANIAAYAVTVIPATLTVTPAPLTVAANSVTRVVNTANPTFTGTIAGALNGDTFTVTYATTATQSSPVGTYPITPAVTGAAAANYTITGVPGSLTITAVIPTALTVTLANATRAFGVANPAFTYTIAGALSGDIFTVIPSTAATIASPIGTYPITATVSGANIAAYTVTVVPGTLTVTPAATSVALTTSGSPVQVGTSITFTATASSLVGIPVGGTFLFFDGATQIGTGIVGTSGIVTLTTSALTPGTHTITASLQVFGSFGTSSGLVSQVVNPGVFVLTSTPPNQFVRGPGVTGYQITATSTLGFAGPVNLTCTGLPADAACAFTGGSTLNLTSGGSATTALTITNTAADAALRKPSFRIPGNFTFGDLSPITAAAVFPFELSGYGIFLAGLVRPGRRRSRKPDRSRGGRLVLLILLSSGILGMAGCGCFTSAFQVYTVVVTGSTTVPGTATQTVSITLTVAAQ
jgi:hypothetical protein